MINVIIYQDSSKQYIGFMLKGHAGYDVSGKDIVCAAVSTLVINTINSIEQLSKDKFIFENDESTGYIKLLLEDKVSLESRILLESLVLGLKSILENENKKYIRIVFKEV